MTSIKLGVHLPAAGPGAPPQAIAPVAEEAERSGLETLWAWERPMRPTAPIAMDGPGGPMMTSGSATVGFAATITSLLILGVPEARARELVETQP